MAKKYIKNNSGVVMSVTTNHLQLEKPLINEHYDIEVHNRNSDKIDNAIQEVNAKIDGLELVASNVKMKDGSTVEDTVSINKTNIENLQISSGNLSQLETIDKSNLVNAINEVFQYANNGKKLIANAIGEPLSSNDTFNAMSNDINGLLSTFKANMMNNGVVVESGDRFKSLIDKITTIVDNEGKGVQYAEGIASSSQVKTFYDVSGLSKQYLTASVNNLNFKPNIVIAFGNQTNYLTSVTVYIENLCFAVSDANRSSSGGSAVNLLNDKNIIVNDNGFTIPHTSSGSVNWYAIGVGEEDTTLRDSLASILQNGGVNVTEEDDMATLIIKVEELIAQYKNK